MTAVPPLLAIAEGRKVRLRAARVETPKEAKLHFLVAKVLREHALPDWRWSHFPAGEIRNIKTATKLKQLGTQKGWPDFIFVSPHGSIRCLELKRSEQSPLTHEQEEFRMWCIPHGVPYVVCWNIDQVLEAFASWGCTRLKL